MRTLFCLVLLGALALPSSAQTSPRFSASVGSYFPGGKTDDRFSYTSVTYQPRLKKASLFNVASVYLDTTRRKRTTGTGTAAVTTIQSMQGLGLSLRIRVVPGAPAKMYEVLGVGIYQRHYSNGTTSTTGYAPGGKFGIGYQYNAVFAEADYTIVGRIKGTDPSGLGLRVGVRF